MHRAYQYLPKSIMCIVQALPEEIKKEACELRLRKGGALSVSTYSKNLIIDKNGRVTLRQNDGYVCTLEDMNAVVSALTQGSVYRYMNTINCGYIVTREGLRAGIGGEAIYTAHSISSVTDISCLNIRLPHTIDSAGDEILKVLKSSPEDSVLVYSPAGYGKTTVIRAVAKGLGTGKTGVPKRVSVIDERGEILPEGCEGLIDRFSGYSKPDGIEIAVRAFSPEYVICDEIGLWDDTEAILSVQNVGVPFIATTHGKSLDEIMLRPNIRKLIEHRVFTKFARLEKEKGRCITLFEELRL